MTTDKLVQIAEQLQAYGEHLLLAGEAEAHEVPANVNLLIEESRKL